MMQVIFTLRVLTPLFLTGADSGTAELRAPSFRGLMRYWHRALVGGLTEATPQRLEKVKQAETALFGATDTGSAVAIKVSAASDQPREFTERTSVSVGGTWQATGKGYLLWSMAKSGKVERGNLKAARWYFPPGTSFQVTLSTRSADTAALEQATATFWLLTQLGSLGSRSRRCAGSLLVQAVQGNPTNLAFSIAEDTTVLKQQIERGIKQVQKIASTAIKTVQEKPQLQPVLKTTAFDTLASGVCRIWILQEDQPWSSAEAAMTRLGAGLQDYRSRVPLEQRRIFGLPLPPKFTGERRASPLLLRVMELQGKRYVGIAVLFKTAASDVPQGDYKVIENWIDTFRGKQEVML